MAAALTDNVVRFVRFELDLERERLRDAGGAELQLPRLSQRLLCYLAANRDRVVPFGEMQDEVWGGVHVGKAAIHQALRQLRSTLGDDGQRQAIIRTVRGVGYRFVAPARSGVAEREAGEDGPLYVGRPARVPRSGSRRRAPSG